MKNKKVIVVKYGSKCVVNRSGLDQYRIDGYARKLASLRKSYQMVVVASGSVAAGKRFWLKGGSSQTMPDPQVLASIGSAGANEAWRRGFQKQGMFAGQILITHQELEDEKERGNLMSAIDKFFNYGVVAVVNENDILSTKELKKLAYGGDNDGLAAHLAITLSAEAVLFLTDTEGYIENGSVRRKVSLSETESLQQHFQNTNEEGTGSMQSKIEAAFKAATVNIKAFIANAETQSYEDIIKGDVGTEVVR